MAVKKSPPTPTDDPAAAPQEQLPPAGASQSSSYPTWLSLRSILLFVSVVITATAVTVASSSTRQVGGSSSSPAAATAPASADAFDPSPTRDAFSTPAPPSPTHLTAPPVTPSLIVNSVAKVRTIVRRALRTEDRRGTLGHGFVGSEERAFQVPRPTTWRTFYYSMAHGNGTAGPTTAVPLGEQMVTLQPAFQADALRPARIAMVTAWGWDDSDARSNAVSGVAVFLKTLFCRRRGYDLYVENTISLLAEVGVATSRNRWANDPLERHHQWAKPVMVAKYLPFYDWVIWQDPDVLPMDFSFDIFALRKRDYPEALLIAGSESEGVPLNTGHYYMRRSHEMVRFLNDAWNSPPSAWFANDQGAFIHTMRHFDTAKFGLTPLTTMGAWVFTGKYDDVRRYKYSHPHAHLTWCPYTGCNVSVAHLTATSLFLNGITTAGGGPVSLGWDLLISPRPKPTVMLSDEAIARIAVVSTFRSAGATEHPSLLEQIRRRWIQYCTHHGYAFEDAPLQGLWHSSKDANIHNDDRWRAIQEVLPYYDWVLYVEPDMTVEDFEAPLTTLVMRSRLATDWIVPSSGREFAFFVRRSVAALTRLETYYSLTETIQSKDLSPSPWAPEPESPTILVGTPAALCEDAATVSGCETVLSVASKRGRPKPAFVLVRLPISRCLDDQTQKATAHCHKYLA